MPLVVSDIREVLGRGVEIVVVDDGSTDATAQVAENLETVLVRHPTNRGKGAAMASGVEAAGGDLIIFMDADATYPAGALPQLIEMLGDHDLVRGERPLGSEAIPPINRLGNRVFNRLIGGFHQIPGRDIMSGLYGMHRRVFEQLDLESTGFDIEVEIGIRARQLGLDVGLFPIDYLPRVGEKKLSPVRDGLNILMRAAGIAILYSPVVTFIIPGLVIMALGVIGSVALSAGPVFIGEVGLSINSFVLATLGVLGGFQLVVFGVAATLYRVESGVPPQNWVLALARRPVRLGAAGLGILLAIVGAIRIVGLVAGWISDGAGEFLATDRLVLDAALFVFGLQLMSAGLFVSMFSGRLAARRG